MDGASDTPIVALHTQHSVGSAYNKAEVRTEVGHRYFSNSRERAWEAALGTAERSIPAALGMQMRSRLFAPHCCSTVQRWCSSKRDDSGATLTHIDRESMMPTMVDVGDKVVTKRVACAQCVVELPKAVVDGLEITHAGKAKHEVQSAKGPVFATAVIGGTLAVKQTSNLIPFCHPLAINACKIDISLGGVREDGGCDVKILCTVSIDGKTGVEMEALTGASMAALTVYDMCKALSQDIVITNTRLVSKSGGKSDFHRASS